ncbi:MAG: hypothetical protein KDD02_02205 [Phaeodactylibacter sp.]|nr:hypothetical protein [Phaeodactylibacter sp.]MCB9302297.1 hypothetical protein [Lewinellaceae bacterium]
MRRLIPFAVVALFLCCWLFPTAIASNCRPLPPPFSGYSFISPRILDPRLPGANLYIDFDALEAYYKQKGNIQVKDNLEEWEERFCGVPELRDIGIVVYQSSISELEQLRSAMKSRSVSLGYQLEDNTFARYLRRNKCEETVTYLIFAKECEPYVIQHKPWEKPRAIYDVMQKLISKGLRDFRKTKSHYIKLRYAYQIIRLAHYSKQYEQVLKLYDALMPQIDNDPSLIEYWIMGHRAGALQALGRNAEAAYLFSRIFENCPSKRETAYRSFRIKNDEEWKQCLVLCQSDRERAVLYAIRANMPDSKLLVEMKNIYTLDPTSPFLELLLIQEMKKLERQLLGLGFNDKRARNKAYYNIPGPDAGARVVGLQQFVTQVLAEGLMPDESLWRLANGYLYLIAGNYVDARKALQEAHRVNTDKLLKEQLEVFDLVLKISSYQTVTDSMENEVGYIREYDPLYYKYEDFTNFTDDKLAQLFRQQGYPGKAFLMNYSLGSLRPNPQPEIMDELIAICLDTNRTRLEDQLVMQGDSTFLNQLLDMRATYLMGQFQFEAALETLKKMDRVEWDNFGLFNPFVERLNDCVKCRLPDTVTVINKGELLERLLDMEYRAKAATERSDWLYYQLGLALYNMSYFSYSWRAMDYYRSGASLSVENLKNGDGVVPDPRFPFGNREQFDCSRARYYFERARIVTTDPNLAARATFMAAKCERNEYYVNRWRADAKQTFDNFELLLQNYPDTEFFLQAIQECKYLQAYATR